LLLFDDHHETSYEDDIRITMAYSVTLKPEPLGKITTTPGTPVRITMNLASSPAGRAAYGNLSPGDDLWGNKLELKAPSGNAGNVYIGKINMVRATLVGVIRVLEPGESWPVTEHPRGNVYHIGDFCFDSDNAADSVHGSVDVI
jgi:hypothetical protein